MTPVERGSSQSSMHQGLVSLLFFLSGSTGLIYEVLWAKYLALYLGSTAQAHAMVLATFLGGLALGNSLLGPWGDRVRSRLTLYGWLEMGIGVLGVLSPLLLSLFSQSYVATAKSGLLHPAVSVGLKISLCAGILLLPAMLMGGTLPVLSRYATRTLSQLESSVSWLYFLNSAGAVLGALLAGFYLIPKFGLDASVSLTAILNVAIGLAALVLGKKIQEKTVSEETKEAPAAAGFEPGPVHVQIMYWGVLVSGFFALVYEIAWIRILSLVLGSSTYSFSLMLSAFIAGIAVGSLLIAKRIAPRINSYLLFGLAELGIAVSILVTLPLYDRLPYYFILISQSLNHTPGAFQVYNAIKFLFCFLLMLLPTVFLGMTLPLAVRVVTSGMDQVAGKVGRIFSMNTAGNVLGAVAAGVFLMPLFGIKGMIEMGIFANMALGMLVVGTAPGWDKAQKAAAAVAMLLLFWVFTWLTPSWNKLILSGGAYRMNFAADRMSYQDFKNAYKAFSLMYYKDDSNATVSVFKQQTGALLLKVNGKTDASTGLDLSTQVLLAQIPLLLNPDARNVLVVGLGSGVTAGSALTHPVEKVDAVEISPAVAEAAQLFAPYNGDVLKNKRFHLYLEDAKTFLKLSNNKYDVIISEPSNPWMSGIGNLFSVDFYKEARDHLAPGGLMVQWFHTYEMMDELVATILRTFSSVFDYVSLWNSRGNDMVLVGSSTPIQPDFQAMQEAMDEASVRADLNRIGIGKLSSFLSLQVASDGLVRKIAGGGRVNKDLFPILEYEAPKAFFLGKESRVIDANDERLGTDKKRHLYFLDYLKWRDKPLDRDDFKDMYEFYGKYSEAILRHIVDEWVLLYPSDTDALWALFLLDKGEGKRESAMRVIRRLLSLQPNNPEYLEAAADLEFERYTQSASYLGKRTPKKAVYFLKKALDAGAANTARIFHKLAQVHALTKDYAAALEYYGKAVQAAREKDSKDPRPDALCMEAAQLCVEMGNIPKARAYAMEATFLNPDNLNAKHFLEHFAEVDKGGNS